MKTKPTLEMLISGLWDDYIALNPQAKAIYELLRSSGEEVVNDHIALRTFRHPHIDLDALASCFTCFGYQLRGEYVFPDKKLNARHYENVDSNQPKIFISELLIESFSPEFQRIVQ